VRDGDHYLINGLKWWSSGAGDPRLQVAIFMGKTDPSAPKHKQQSMIVVPLDAPGVRLCACSRSLATTMRPMDTARFNSKTFACPRGIFFWEKGEDSKSRKDGSGQGGFITACV